MRERELGQRFARARRGGERNGERHVEGRARHGVARAPGHPARAGWCSPEYGKTCCLLAVRFNGGAGLAPTQERERERDLDLRFRRVPSGRPSTLRRSTNKASLRPLGQRCARHFTVWFPERIFFFFFSVQKPLAVVDFYTAPIARRDFRGFFLDRSQPRRSPRGKRTERARGRTWQGHGRQPLLTLRKTVGTLCSGGGRPDDLRGCRRGRVVPRRGTPTPRNEGCPSRCVSHRLFKLVPRGGRWGGGVPRAGFSRTVPEPCGHQR